MLAGDSVLIPWTERAIGKEEVALLLGCEPRGVLERHAAGFDYGTAGTS